MKTFGRGWLPAAAVLAVAAGSLGSCSSDGAADRADATTTTAEPTALEAAAAAADVHVQDVQLDDVEVLIQNVCSTGDAGQLAQLVLDLGVTDADDLRSVVEGVGRGAVVQCPSVAEDDPGLINDAYAAALALLPGGITSTTDDSGGDG